MDTHKIVKGVMLFAWALFIFLVLSIPYVRWFAAIGFFGVSVVTYVAWSKWPPVRLDSYRNWASRAGIVLVQDAEKLPVKALLSLGVPLFFFSNLSTGMAFLVFVALLAVAALFSEERPHDGSGRTNAFSMAELDGSYKATFKAFPGFCWGSAAFSGLLFFALLSLMNAQMDNTVALARIKPSVNWSIWGAWLVSLGSVIVVNHLTGSFSSLSASVEMFLEYWEKQARVDFLMEGKPAPTKAELQARVYATHPELVGFQRLTVNPVLDFFVDVHGILFSGFKQAGAFITLPVGIASGLKLAQLKDLLNAEQARRAAAFDDDGEILR